MKKLNTVQINGCRYTIFFEVSEFRVSTDDEVIGSYPTFPEALKACGDHYMRETNPSNLNP